MSPPLHLVEVVVARYPHHFSTRLSQHLRNFSASWLKERPCRNKSQSFCPVDEAHVPVSHSILSISANLKTSGVHAYGTVHDLPILINPQSWLWLKLGIHDAFTFHCSLSVSNASLISVELQLCGAFLHCRQFLDLESWRTSNAARQGSYWML